MDQEELEKLVKVNFYLRMMYSLGEHHLKLSLLQAVLDISKWNCHILTKTHLLPSRNLIVKYVAVGLKVMIVM